MRVAGNSIGQLHQYYLQELRELYDQGEIKALLQTVISSVCQVPYNKALLHPEQRIQQSELIKIYSVCERLVAGEPIQYVLNEAWFAGLKLYVDDRVLIPRPETEELVEIVINTLENGKPKKILDLCTGSGCIALALKNKLPKNEVSGNDISERALAVARKNALSLGLDIKFFMFDVTRQDLDQTFDIFISNPPYVLLEEKESMHKSVSEHEPSLALFVTDGDPVLFYRSIIQLSISALNPGGSLFFELNPVTAEQVRDLAIASNLFKEITLMNDLSGKPRFLHTIKTE